jgi:ferredoxin-NADP reductase
MPQKLRCEVVEILDHGEGVYSVFLKPESLAPRFLPGQFLHLALDEYKPGDFWPDSRTFSIASPPADRQLLRITYAVKGQFTRRMEKELLSGRLVWVKMPYGEFIVRTDHNEVCLLAGGTGVTAFTAFLGGLTGESLHMVHFFYGARHPGLLIYRSVVEEASQRCPALDVHFLAEEGAEKTDCLPGLITSATVFRFITDPLAVTYYLAGPPGMVKALVTDLQQDGVAADQIITDAWE